jgi:dihydroflavonol-4-reductase
MYHVAASYSIDERNRGGILADAAEGTEATLEAARRAGIEKIVVTSSVATLGTTKDPEPMDESKSFNLKDPNAYAAAKVAEEEVAIRCAEAGAPITIVSPSMVVGPGDWKPTPSGQQIVNYLGYSPSLRWPFPPGGFSYTDVDDVAQGHILAMEKGRVGERYILGGENLTNEEMFRILSDVTGLAEPGSQLSRSKLNFGASIAELYGRWMERAPLFTRRVVDDYFDSYVFVTSEKAKQELGYESRPARQGFARSCRWYLDHGYVSEKAARRARLELQPA